jgi:hypothetical protein
MSLSIITSVIADLSSDLQTAIRNQGNTISQPVRNLNLSINCTFSM